MSDELTLRTGEVLTGGRVVEETWAEVKYETGGTTRALPAWKVARAARWEEALAAFDRVRRGGAGVPDWAVPEGAFHHANTLRLAAAVKNAGWAEAGAALEAFPKAHPLSRLAPAAHYGLGEVRLAEQDLPGAKAAYGRLDEKQFGIAWNLLGFFGSARATLADGKAAEAEALLRALEDQAEKVEGCGEVRRMATVARAEAVRALGKPEEALRLLEPLLADEAWSHAPVTAQALNFAGETVLALGDSPDHAGTAAVMFLRVVRYFPEYHAEFGRALARTARCFRALENPEWVEAAAEAVRANYPGSRWEAELG